MKFSVLIAIVAEELEDKAIEVAKRAGASGVTILTARGIGAREKKTFFGLTYEGRESVLIYILERKLALEVLKALNKELKLEEKDHGIAFILPIEHLAGIDKYQIAKFTEKIKEEI